MLNRPYHQIREHVNKIKKPVNRSIIFVVYIHSRMDPKNDSLQKTYDQSSKRKNADFHFNEGNSHPWFNMTNPCSTKRPQPDDVRAIGRDSSFSWWQGCRWEWRPTTCRSSGSEAVGIRLGLGPANSRTSLSLRCCSRT
jgi:hypothetical protein